LGVALAGGILPMCDHADADASPAPSSGVRVANDDYIACAGLETVNVAVCLESPTGPVIDLLRRRP